MLEVIESFPLWQGFALLAIYFGSAVFSGLSGFGFSAIGCLSLTILSPTLGIALLMALSLMTQASSFISLYGDLKNQSGALVREDSVAPYLAGGLTGMPLGLKIVVIFGSQILTASLGVMLILYSAYSLFKPAALVLNIRQPRSVHSFLVGAVGGVVGGVSAFPGSALVVWNGLLGVTKAKSRALTQPYIIFMQIVGLWMTLWFYPKAFDPRFWTLLMFALPIALLGTHVGVQIYKKTGDIGYRKFTFIALGVSGLGLLMKIALATP